MTYCYCGRADCPKHLAAAADLARMDNEQVRQAVNDILDDAVARRVELGLAGESVNWADLSCVEVVDLPADGDESTYRIAVIAEADTSCHALQAFVEDELRKRGVDDVQALTEW